MIKINEIPNNEEPRKKIMSKLDPHFEKTAVNKPWMEPTESSFICSLLQVYRPKKILEVGVAAGGTTAIVLQVLEDMNMSYELHSVDLAPKTLGGKDTGFLATFAKENNLLTTPHQSTLRGTHEFYLGKYLPQVIDEIGGDIDFVILDTVHYTPGELLDFLVMLPYLKDNAIVVLHDVALNQRNLSYHTPDAHATGLLFSAVVAEEKFLNYEPEGNYPNIGAFRVNEQTYNNIENVFLALMLTWNYLPKDDEITIYRNFYNRYYPAKLVKIFDETVRLNRNNVAFKKPATAPAKPEVAPPKPAVPTKTEVAPPKSVPTQVKTLSYQTHVGGKGWGSWINENQISDPLDQKRDIQAIKIQFPEHKVYYSVYYNEKEGWSKEILSPEMAGTTGKSKSIYGIRIRLDEADTKIFDILYRVHKYDDTWTPWAKNYEAIYSQGQKINAIQIKLEPKTK